MMRDLHHELLDRLHEHRDEIVALSGRIAGHWVYEDGLYRYWYHSWKVFHLQDDTKRIVELLERLAPDTGGLIDEFRRVVDAGMGREFSYESTNDNWEAETRPIVDAFFHAKWALDMCVRAVQLDEAPQLMPSGWAGLTCLYGIR